MNQEQYQTLLELRDTLLEEGQEDQATILEQLLDIMKPTTGIDPDLARTKPLQKAHCGNCGFEWPVLACNTELTAAINTMQRLTKCVRCQETENITLTAQ